MSQPFRLPSTGLIDRSSPLGFTFDGIAYQGYSGDTLASALIANGVSLVGRSFKYHRPRGIFTSGSEEPNALVELRSGARREPNTRATTVELFGGLEATSQNRWPSLKHDLLAVNGLFERFLGAGFYYKTFMWPAAFWEKLYEPLIRRAAGLGRMAEAPDPDDYDQLTDFCDVLVIGAGPAGLMAAQAAAHSGARVILADEDWLMGGRLNAETLTVDDKDSPFWAAGMVAELSSLPNVTLMPRTTVFGAYDHGQYGALERVADHLLLPEPGQPRQRLWRINARRTVLAAGSIERPIVFPGNDLPGVMLSGATRAYANRYAARAGTRAVVVATGDDGWRTALDLHAAGIAIAAVIDSRTDVPDATLALAGHTGAEMYAGAHVVQASGKMRVSSVTIRLANGTLKTYEADLLAIGNGWNPNVALTCHHGGKPAWNEATRQFLPGRLPPGMSVAGAAAGRMTVVEALRDGTRAGAAAAADLGFKAADIRVPEALPERNGNRSVWRVKGGPGRSRTKAFVDLQNDVTDGDIELAHREGYRSVELLKRYTTLGMATDQGKTANLPALAIMAELTGKGIADTGTTVFRPPYTPVAFGALAGRHRGKDFRPTRYAPTHDWSRKAGAVFIESGAWIRASYYPRPGETTWRETVDREVLAVRTGVGLCDVSTLGKIEISGRDAGVFLDRVYINTFSTLSVGKARYGVMLREDGFVYDDGTTARLDENRYVMSTTTANAVGVMQHLDVCHQVLWPDLDVRMVSVTEQWAQVAVAGPKSRDVLRAVVDDAFDLSDAALPYMGAIEVTVGGGIPARLFRISFSGELAYEIAVPSAYGDALARALFAAGAPLGIVPYGLEAMGVMRIEKGHVAGGELGGHTTARDLGLGRMQSKTKDYIGRVMAGRPALVDPDRPTLAGFRPVNPADRFASGAHFVAKGKPMDTAHDQGWVTSVCYSPHVGSMIGLGLIRGGKARIGERVVAADPVRGLFTEVEICDPVFIDPKGERLHG